jgi:hypothetical protein
LFAGAVFVVSVALAAAFWLGPSDDGISGSQRGGNAPSITLAVAFHDPGFRPGTIVVLQPDGTVREVMGEGAIYPLLAPNRDGSQVAALEAPADASAPEATELVVFDTRSNSVAWRAELTLEIQFVGGLTWSPEGEYVAAIGRDGVDFVDAKTQTVTTVPVETDYTGRSPASAAWVDGRLFLLTYQAAMLVDPAGSVAWQVSFNLANEYGNLSILNVDDAVRPLLYGRREADRGRLSCLALDTADGSLSRLDECTTVAWMCPLADPATRVHVQVEIGREPPICVEWFSVPSGDGELDLVVKAYVDLAEAAELRIAGGGTDAVFWPTFFTVALALDER